MKKLGIALEIAAAVLLSPLVIWGGTRGTLAYFAALSLLAARGVRREIADPLKRLEPTRGSDGA